MTDNEFVFLVPDVEAVPAAAAPADPELRRDALPLPFGRRSKEVAIKSSDVETFWRDKVVGLTKTISEANAEHDVKGFRVDEISFSLGVGAKGGVLFVAEGSIEATISVKLGRSG